MKYALDKKYAVIDHTIVSYSGKNISLQVPEKIDNIWIRSIGSGAFMELPELQYVMLPPRVTSIESFAFASNPNLVSVIFPGSVKNIGVSAFHGCKQLSEVTIYDFVMEEKEYVDLKINSIRASNEIYVARKVPSFGIIQQILLATMGIFTAYSVPDQVNRLFYMAQLPTDNGQQLMYRNVNNICFNGQSSQPITEDQGIIEYLKQSNENFQVIMADELNDGFLRTNRYPVYRKTAIFTFDDKETKAVNGKRSLSVTIRFGYFFFQSMCPVLCDGKQYYVYRRYYLNPDQKPEFLRRDVAIYTDQGVVMDKKEAQKVYAKYKFLCIL